MRKLRAADRLLLFHCVLRAKRDHVRHLPILCDHWQPTQGTRETQGKAIQQPDHCTPLFLALALALWCVELHVSTSRTPPHCEGHSPFQWTSQRWGWAILMPPLSQGGTRAAMALPRDGNIAPPRWLLPTLPYSPPHANRRGVQLQCENTEQQRSTP